MQHRYFFSGDLAQFNIPMETPSKHVTRSGKPRPPRLDVLKVLDAIGERSYNLMVPRLRI